MTSPMSQAPLAGITVLDLSRIMAGPWATQLLADLGARVIKIEKPGAGDDTRGWGPPFLKDRNGHPTDIAAYYLAANRSKQALAVDIAAPEGQAIIRKLAEKADICIENFKVGGLKKYGLDYASLSAFNPRLIYCSITGFGQDGPYRDRPGYDYMIQAMGGLMSVTGTPEEPMRVGVPTADLLTGMYATVGILAALQARHRTGKGQYIDLALYDVQAAMLSNQAMNYLVGGQVPGRIGNRHPSIVPYQLFATKDGYMILAVGNDGQFARFCTAAGCEELAADARFATNAGRVKHRDMLIPLLEPVLQSRSTAEWLEMLDKANVPCGPVQNIAETFAHPQAEARGLVQQAEHLQLGSIPTVRNPLRFSETPTTTPTAPPTLGQDSEAVLRDAGYVDAEIARLRDLGVIG